MTRRQGLRALRASQRSEGQASAKVAQARSHRTDCNDGGSTRLILYTKYKRGEGLTCDNGGSTRTRE